MAYGPSMSRLRADVDEDYDGPQYKDPEEALFKGVLFYLPFKLLQ